MPACHHWSWSSTKLASDQRTTAARTSFGPVGVDEVGDVELGGGSRVLGEPDRPSVDDHVEHPFDAAEMQHDSPPAPSARQGERAAVEPRRIVLGHVRGRRVERHHDVRVVRRLVAEHRPEARHLDCPPTTRARGRRGCQVGTVDQAELPSPVERPEPPRARPVERGRELGSRERRERRPGRQRAEARQLGTLPARAPAREEECRERVPGMPSGGRPPQSASRSACAACSGDTGLKKTPEPSSPAAT